MCVVCSCTSSVLLFLCIPLLFTLCISLPYPTWLVVGVCIVPSPSFFFVIFACFVGISGSNFLCWSLFDFWPPFQFFKLSRWCLFNSSKFFIGVFRFVDIWSILNQNSVSNLSYLSTFQTEYQELFFARITRGNSYKNTATKTDTTLGIF